MPNEVRTRAALYRGGTSKAFIVERKDLPTLDPAALDDWILAAYGSPDIRQIDGVGGADGLTSKFAVVGPPTRPDADVDYAFAQVGIDTPTIDWTLICGNISSAIGPYAIEHGLVPAVEPITAVRIHSLNTGKLIVCYVPVRDGRVVTAGSERIDGVPGTGAPIELDFRDAAGLRGAGLLPTGNAMDVAEVEGLGSVEYSVVDAAVPTIFMDAAKFGFTGAEDPKEIERHRDRLEAADRVRAVVAARLGWASSPETARTEARLAPVMVLVSSPADWLPYGTGRMRTAEEADVAVRSISFQNCHKAFPVTGSVATAAAAAISGTVVNRAVRAQAHATGRYRLAHPGGLLVAVAQVETEGGEYRLRKAGIVRTARRLLEGEIFTLPPSPGHSRVFAAPGESA